jgi:hypothetical protein
MAAEGMSDCSIRRWAPGWQATAFLLLAIPAVFGDTCDTNAVTNAFQRVTRYSLKCQRALEVGSDSCSACEPYYGAYCGFCTVFGDSDAASLPTSWSIGSHNGIDLEEEVAVCADYVDAVTNCRDDLASMRANWSASFGCKGAFPCSTAKLLPKVSKPATAQMEVSVSASHAEDEPSADFAGAEKTIVGPRLDHLTLLVANTPALGLLPHLLASRLRNVTYPNTTLPLGELNWHCNVSATFS